MRYFGSALIFCIARKFASNVQFSSFTGDDFRNSSFFSEIFLKLFFSIVTAFDSLFGGDFRLDDIGEPADRADGLLQWSPWSSEGCIQCGTGWMMRCAQKVDKVCVCV